jgi:hypothetical protein
MPNPELKYRRGRRLIWMQAADHLRAIIAERKRRDPLRRQT